MANEEIKDWRRLGLKSMDMILCVGTSKMSRRIQKFQRFTGAPKEYAKFSHVARIRTSNSIDLHVQESTSLNKWADKSGVQENPMVDWLRNYDGEVFVRKLDFMRTHLFLGKDYDFWMDHKGDNYEHGIPGAIELLLCGLRLHRYVRWVFPNYVPRFTTEPHCTELNALAIDKHGKWNSGDGIFKYAPPPFNRMPPWMWAEEIDKWLTCPIGPLVQIK